MAEFIQLADCFDRWKRDLLSGRKPELYQLADAASPLSTLELGPGRVWVIGGSPGAGKTAFCLQLLVDALRLTPSLNALVCNVEMPVPKLLERQLARLSGIPLSVIQRREFTDIHRERLDVGLDALQRLGPQLAFCQPPYTLANIAESADALNAEIIVVDYIQRIRTTDNAEADRRAHIDNAMAVIRQWATDAAVAVIVVAALSRQKSTTGSTYDGAGLASFRESSELEYGADDAFILQQTEPGKVALKHVKSRYGERRDMALRFDGSLQRFEPLNTGTAWDDIAAAWGPQE